MGLFSNNKKCYKCGRTTSDIERESEEVKRKYQGKILIITPENAPNLMNLQHCPSCGKTVCCSCLKKVKNADNTTWFCPKCNAQVTLNLD